MSVSADYNPFEPLQETSSSVDLSPLEQWRQVIRQFRQESNALAGVAFFFASSAAIMTLFVSGNRVPAVILVLIGFAVAISLAVASVQIALMKTIGVRILLFFHYVLLLLTILSMAGLFIGAGLEGVVFIAVVGIGPGLTAAQCHRVLRISKRLKSAGIPLYMKPHELSTEHFRQLLNNSANEL